MYKIEIDGNELDGLEFKSGNFLNNLDSIVCKYAHYGMEDSDIINALNLYVKYLTPKKEGDL